MGSEACISNSNGRLQKASTKRSRDVAAHASLTRSSSCGKQKLSCTNTISKMGSTSRNSSKYRGVTRHRWTGRYEAHLWDKNSWNQSQSKKGRQVYLGAYDNEETAAHAYDLAALKYWGSSTILNFPVEMYGKEIEDMQCQTREEYIASLRRKSNGFSRGVSKYRGVARHHHNGRWEARIGRVYGNKYLYLGTYSTQEEAAMAYDLAALQYRGLNAVTNFDMSNYLRCLPPGHKLLVPTHPSPSTLQGTDNNDSSTNTAASNSGTMHHKGTIAPPAGSQNQSDFLLHHPFRPNFRSPLLRFCARASYAAAQIDNQPAKDDSHNNLLIMQLENILGTSNEHLNSIQDQVSATCSAPPPPAEYLQQPSVNAGVPAAYHVSEFPPQLMTPGPKPALAGADASDPTQLSTAYHLEKLMAEYKELLQSPKPKDMGTLSAIVDSLSDTASSATTSSLFSAVQTVSNDSYALNHPIIKPGGYVAGLLCPQEECIRYMDQTFNIIDVVPGSVDSICSSNDLSSFQELVACSNLPDIHCNNNALFNPFRVHSVSSDELFLDTNLSNSNVAPLLPSTLNNMLHKNYLPR